MVCKVVTGMMYPTQSPVVQGPPFCVGVIFNFVIEKALDTDIPCRV